MIKVKASIPTSDEWRRWCEQAAAESAKLLDEFAQGRQISILERLYKDQGKEILAIFHGKCAYCERMIGLDQFGDVDHYRPKKGVTDERHRPVMISRNGKDEPHPGYFWLAYQWDNLLPSCVRCNRPGKQGGVTHGKWNRFPIAGNRAFRPEETEAEQPLLLNPWIDDPTEHLDVDASTGVVFAKSDRGRASIEILNLNREGLPEARRDVFVAVMARAREHFEALRRNDAVAVQEHLNYLRGVKEGRVEFSMIGRLALAQHLAVLKKQQEEFT